MFTLSVVPYCTWYEIFHGRRFARRWTTWRPAYTWTKGKTTVNCFVRVDNVLRWYRVKGEGEGVVSIDSSVWLAAENKRNEVVRVAGP